MNKPASSVVFYVTEFTVNFPSPKTVIFFPFLILNTVKISSSHTGANNLKSSQNYCVAESCCH